MDLTLAEADIINQRITAEVDPDANIISGTTLNQDLSGSIQVSVVATGLDPNAPQPTLTAQPARPAETLINPPENPIPTISLEPKAAEPVVEEPPLIPSSGFEFMPVGKMAAAPSEALVVDGEEKVEAAQATLLSDTPPSLGVVAEIKQSVPTEEPINLTHKTAESNVTSVKPDLFKLVPGLWNLRNTNKQKHAGAKPADKEPPLPELDLSIPSFFK